MTDDESIPNDEARRWHVSLFELRREKTKSAVILSEAKDLSNAATSPSRRDPSLALGMAAFTLWRGF
jgi:hypothetical protein